MSRHARRAESRGHLLIEAMVGGAVLLLAIGGISSALTASSESLARATLDQQALDEAQARVEWLRAQPLTSPAWLVTSTPASGFVPSHPDWRWQIDVAEVNDTFVSGAAMVLKYRKATVTVRYGAPQREVSLETLKW